MKLYLERIMRPFKLGYFVPSLLLCTCLFLITPILSGAAEETVMEVIPEDMQDAFAPALRTPDNSATPMGLPVAVEMRLEAVSIGPDKAAAVINGEVYTENEEKEGIKVVQIRRKEVDVILNGIQQTLTLLEKDPTALVGISSEIKSKLKKAKESPVTSPVKELEDPLPPADNQDTINSMQDLLSDL